MGKQTGYAVLALVMLLAAYFASGFLIVILWQIGVLSDSSAQFAMAILHTPLRWLGLSQFPPPQW